MYSDSRHNMCQNILWCVCDVPAQDLHWNFHFNFLLSFVACNTSQLSLDRCWPGIHLGISKFYWDWNPGYQAQFVFSKLSFPTSKEQQFLLYVNNSWPEGNLPEIWKAPVFGNKISTHWRRSNKIVEHKENQN